MRGLLTEWLTGAGYAVRERGVRAAPAGEGADLVIVDLYMPRQAGADIVLAAQQAYPGAPVIAMSAQFRPGLECPAGAAHPLGVDKLWCKRLARDDLVRAWRAFQGAAP